MSRRAHVVAVVVALATLAGGLSMAAVGLTATAASAASSGAVPADRWDFPVGGVDPRAPVNGCGSQGEDGTDVPDEWFGVSFTDACNWHDRCYGTKGLAQSYCDRGMRSRAHDACGSDNWACEQMADLYYLGVAAFGAEPYQQGQEAACERDPRRNGRVHGDPHLQTLDGRAFSLMAAGEFSLLRDADDQDLIQARFYPVTDDFTVVTGVAVRIGEREVVVDVDPETYDVAVRVDGQLVERDMAAFDEGLVDMGTALVGARQVISIRSWDGLLVEALVLFGRVDLSIQVPEALWGEVHGLLGNANGDPADDLFDRNGALVPMDITSSELNADDDIKEAYRVAPPESMFTADSATFDYHADDIGKYPVSPDPLAAFSAAQVDRARELCTSFGLEGNGLATCTFDVLVSGDDGYAQQSARSAQRARYLAHPHDDASHHHAGGADVVAQVPLVAAVEAGDTAEVERLLDTGEDIDVGRASDGFTPLVAALSFGRHEIARLLIERGADPNAFGPAHNAPLHVAVAADRPIEIVRLLLEAGADPNGRNDATSNGLANPLAAAAASGRLEVIQLLLDFGAEVDGPGGAGGGGAGAITPLYFAAGEADLAVARLLLANGANPNGRYPNGDAGGPLQMAAITGNVDMVELLIDAGADPGSATPPGVSAQMLTDDEEILELLGS